MNQNLSILFAGGGTGGHLNPGIAIAQEFLKRDPDTNVLFVGTNRLVETALLSKAGFAHRSITSQGIKGKRLLKKSMSLLMLPIGFLESAAILASFRPNLVVGIGSYAAGPVAAAAWAFKRKIVLHEQNVLPGMTNRVLSRIADRVYVSFCESAAYLAAGKAMVTGNPVRAEIESIGDTGPVNEKADGRQMTILITGGSQGAHSINQAVTDSLSLLDRKDDFYFIHQTGVDDERWVAEAYRRWGVSGRIQAFFDDMAAQYRLSDLVICRAGASTVAEITAMGKSALFVPLPHSADNHQEINARALKDAGGADMILQKSLSGQSMLEKIRAYANKPELLTRMGQVAKGFAKKQAASRIVDDCYRLLEL